MRFCSSFSPMNADIPSLFVRIKKTFTVFSEDTPEGL